MAFGALAILASLRSASKGKKLGVGRHDDGFYHEATKSRRYLKKRHDNNHAEDGPDRGFRELRGYDGANGGERFVSSRPGRAAGLVVIPVVLIRQNGAE